MFDELKVGANIVIVKERPNHCNFTDNMEKFLGKILTIKKIYKGWNYVEVHENKYVWIEGFIDWEATSKLNSPSKLSANTKLEDSTVENLVNGYKKATISPLVQIKNVIECQPFKYEYYSEGSFCVSLYESEVPITYYNGKLEFDPEICNTTLTRDMVEEVAKVMLIVEENLEFFLLKGE